jgi:Spy/CpxP family protein refolding chaperone
MRSRIRILLIILSVSLNVAFVAAWGIKTMVQTANAAKQEKSVCSPDSSCHIWCPLHRALGTTEAQWKTLEPLQLDFQTISQRLSQRVDSLRAQLATLMAQPVADRASIDSNLEEILGAQRQMQSLVVTHLLDEKRVLTAEQQAKLFEMVRDNGACAGYGGMMGMSRGARKCPQTKNHESSQ